MDEQAQINVSIHLTAIHIAMGDENPRDLINQIKTCSELHIDLVLPGFSQSFMADEQVEILIRSIHLKVHEQHISQLLKLSRLKDQYLRLNLFLID